MYIIPKTKFLLESLRGFPLFYSIKVLFEDNNFVNLVKRNKPLA